VVKYQVVSDSLREGPNRADEVGELLAQGKTLHVTGITNSDLGTWYSRFKARYDRKLRRRLSGSDQADGYILWFADDDEPTP
jgi:hypothetical protein